jgi:hypothetical protein
MVQRHPVSDYSYLPSHYASTPQSATDLSKDDPMLKKIEALQALIKQQDDERIAREQAIVAAAATKKAKDEQEALQSAEVAAASAAAKAAAEKAAEEAAKTAKEESDKKLAEAEAAKAELEKKQKELEEAVAKAAPVPDMLKAPIKFKDAVGRKFSFPWHLCKTWKGMESLIKQAFLHVDVIGAHVQEGHYDLMGPEGEIILPQVWDIMIKPDWEVSMHMWPIPEAFKKGKKEEQPDDVVDAFMAQQLAQMAAGQVVSVEAVEPAKKPKKDGKKTKRNSIPPAPPAPPVVSGPSTAPPVETLQFNSREEYDLYLATGQLPPMIMDPVSKLPKPKPKPKRVSGIAAWMAGAPVKPARKDDGKLEPSASNNNNNRSHSPSSQSPHIIPVTSGNVLAKRRESTAESSWTSTSASSSPPAKFVVSVPEKKMKMGSGEEVMGRNDQSGLPTRDTFPGIGVRDMAGMQENAQATKTKAKKTGGEFSPNAKPEEKPQLTSVAAYTTAQLREASKEEDEKLGPSTSHQSAPYSTVSLQDHAYGPDAAEIPLPHSVADISHMPASLARRRSMLVDAQQEKRGNSSLDETQAHGYLGRSSDSDRSINYEPAEMSSVQSSSRPTWTSTVATSQALPMETYLCGPKPTTPIDTLLETRSIAGTLNLPDQDYHACGVAFARRLEIDLMPLLDSTALLDLCDGPLAELLQIFAKMLLPQDQTGDEARTFVFRKHRYVPTLLPYFFLR